MDSPQGQSGTNEKGFQDGEGTMTDKYVAGQEPVGNASLSHSQMISSHRSSLDHTTSHWRNIAAQDMIAVGGFGTAGRQSRTASAQQNAGTAQDFVTTPSIENSQDILPGGSFGRPGQFCFTCHHNSAERGGFNKPEGSFHVLQGQGTRHLDNTVVGQGPENDQQQSPGAVGEISSGHCGDPDIQRARTLHNSPPDSCHGKEGVENDLTTWDLHLQNPSPNTGEEDYSALGVNWNFRNANKNVAATSDLYHFPPHGYIAGEGYYAPQQGLLGVQGLRNSYGGAVVPHNLDNHFEHSLATPDSSHASASFYNADGQCHTNQHSYKSSLAAQSCYNGHPGAHDAGGKVSTKDLEEQNNLVVGRDLANAPVNMHDAREHRSLAPQKPGDVHGSGQLPPDFRRNAPPNVFEKPAQLSAKAGTSAQITPWLPTLHNSLGFSASPVAADQASFQHHDDDDDGHKYNTHQHHNFSITTTPAFYSPNVSTGFNKDAPSVGRIPYVAISGSCTTNALRSNTNTLGAPPKRFDPRTDTLPFTDPPPSFKSTSTSSSSKTHIATMFPPHGIVITDADMELAVAYCFDRGNGQYTRLVPVDVLPFSLRDLPARVSSHEGMIVLPVPRMGDPNGQPGNGQLAAYVSGNSVTPPVSPIGTAQGGSADLIQNRIDNIVAAAPNAAPGPVVLARSNTTIIGTGRREKVYCDKWIHDGTCAFTQQGCKFKHEMPMDKETQQSLGLFHGLPAWYRKQEAERVMHLDDRPVPLGGGAVGYYGVGPASGRLGNNGGAFGAGPGGASRAQNWRRIEAAPPTQGATFTDDDGSSPLSGGSASRVGHGRGRNNSRVANYRTNNFGPIGPPSQSSGALSGGLGGNRHRTNTVASFGVHSSDGYSGREVQRDDAAPRGGVRLANNPFEALEDYASTSNTESDKGKGVDETLD